MPKSLSRSFFVLAASLLIGGGSAAIADLSQDRLRALIPADGAAAGWVRDGELQEFAGEDLYTYIDGGAEIYQEYGFRRVAIQDYKNAAGKSVSLEIFEMAAPDAAYGMYTFKRSGNGKVLALGSEGELEDYYLNFWKGRYLVTVTGFDETAETVAGVVAISRVVDSKIVENGKIPELVGFLPAEGLVDGSVKYVKGLLGLNNIYPFHTARGLTFKEAVRGLYRSGETLMILEYGTAEVRRAAWAELRAGLEKSGRFDQPGNYLADAVVFKDGKGQYVAFREVGTRLAIGIHSTLDWALLTVGRVR